MPSEFQKDYDMLELHARADWEAAKASYRRLVNHWHPDRYADDSQKHEQAEQQFIALTKSFNRLRSFHRDNHRLPFQTPDHNDTASPEAIGPRKNRATDSISPSNDAIPSAGLAGRRRSQFSLRSQVIGRQRQLLWILPGLVLLVGSLGFFVVMDRQANQKTIEEAREVLRQTPPSQYMPSAREIQEKTARGRFIDPNAGSGILK